jgi:hypothetical protein
MVFNEFLGECRTVFEGLSKKTMSGVVTMESFLTRLEVRVLVCTHSSLLKGAAHHVLLIYSEIYRRWKDQVSSLPFRFP